jgi:glycosyltransferase involved in cell wall biosynthesis
MRIAHHLKYVFPAGARAVIKKRYPHLIERTAIALDSVPIALNAQMLRLRWRWLDLLLRHSLSTKMWCGFGHHVMVELEQGKFQIAGKPIARPGFAWSLARWYADTGAYERALDNLVLMMAAAPKLRRNVNVQIMMVECLLRLNRMEHAKNWLEWASKGIRNPRPEFYLSAANISHALSAQAGHSSNYDVERLTWINRVYEDAGFSKIEKRDENAPLTLENIFVRNPRPVSSAVKLSILMPAYNCADTLPIALTSILNQTWGNIEVIIVDDRSSDETWSVIERFAQLDSRIVPIRHEQNGGAYAARNTALAHATGEYVTVHDADDWSHPEKFAAQMLYALAQPDGISTTVGVRVNRDLRFGVKPNAGGMIMENLSSFLLKRSILTEVGGWDRTRMGADSELYERVKAKYGLASNKLFPRAPLTLILFSGLSLTQSSATGITTLLYGARRQYKEAYRFWHATELAKSHPDFRMSPDRRFPAPRIMLRRNEPITDIDVVFIGDFAESERSFEHDTAQWKSLAITGLKLGIIHWPTYIQAERNITPLVRSAIAEGCVENIVPGETVACKVAVSLEAKLFDTPPNPLPIVQSEHLFVVNGICLSEHERGLFSGFFGSAPQNAEADYIASVLNLIRPNRHELLFQ